MKYKLVNILLLFAVLPFSFADDSEAARQYVIWIRQAIEENRISEAETALDRAVIFSDVNSDVSFLKAFILSLNSGKRQDIISFLDTAIDVNRWDFYSENEALVLKAQHLIAMRRFSSALSALEQIREGDISRGARTDSLPLSANIAMLRLKAFRGIAVISQSAHGDAGGTELAAFRSLALSTINRFPRDPGAALIFLEYLQAVENGRRPRNRARQPGSFTGALTAGDQQILDLIIRRLPVLAELDPNLAWIAASFMKSEAEAKRYIAAYRAGNFLKNAEGFFPNPQSVPLALNLGLISDAQAVEEIFFPPQDAPDEGPFLISFNVLNDTYNYLRSEESRMFFTQSLLKFNGSIISDDDFDGIYECRVYFDEGIIKNFWFDSNQDNYFDIQIAFDSNGIPETAVIPVLGAEEPAFVYWERYPFVKMISLSKEAFNFRPADFNYSPISFIVLGGSRNSAGISYPVLSGNDINRRMMVSFCSHIDRFSVEFEQAIERIYLAEGIPVQAVEFFDNKIISVTEFESGFPVIQYVDLDLDGRMETLRRFHRPGTLQGQDYTWPDPEEKFDYRKLISSSESDWTGEGRFKTGEVYLKDRDGHGSFIFMFDIDGFGSMHSIEFD